MASQWPIPPGHFFDYQLKPETPGTYFYHSHVGMQGSLASGALIVEDSGPPPYQYDEERVIVFQETWIKTDDEISDMLLDTPGDWPNDPEF